MKIRIHCTGWTGQRKARGKVIQLYLNVPRKNLKTPHTTPVNKLSHPSLWWFSNSMKTENGAVVSAFWNYMAPVYSSMTCYRTMCIPNAHLCSTITSLIIKSSAEWNLASPSIKNHFPTFLKLGFCLKLNWTWVQLIPSSFLSVNWCTWSCYACSSCIKFIPTNLQHSSRG